MNKQRSMLLEISLIAGIIIAAGIIIWNSDFTGSARQETPKPKDDLTINVKKPYSDKASDNKSLWAEGKTLFKANCAACHNPKVAQTGPALMGVTKRWEDAGGYQGKTGKQWLYTWIKNWNAPVAAAYPYAVNISNYSPSTMSVFTTLKDEDIDKILIYVETPDYLSQTVIAN